MEAIIADPETFHFHRIHFAGATLEKSGIDPEFMRRKGATR
jgi:hypothetical protein